MDDYTRWRLLNGLDEIDITLRLDDDIARFETFRSPLKPSLRAR
jgi:3-isopropylmalate/(R)-2-methylmalate dehydratase small subunit